MTLESSFRLHAYLRDTPIRHRCQRLALIYANMDAQHDPDRMVESYLKLYPDSNWMLDFPIPFVVIWMCSYVCWNQLTCLSKNTASRDLWANLWLCAWCMWRWAYVFFSHMLTVFIFFDSLRFLEFVRNSPHLCFYSKVPRNPSPCLSLCKRCSILPCLKLDYA